MLGTITYHTFAVEPHGANDRDTGASVLVTTYGYAAAYATTYG